MTNAFRISYRQRVPFLLAAVATMIFVCETKISAQTGKLGYRGFTVDLTGAQDVPDIAAIEVSIEHQIDIVADCGASPDILAFFRSQEIALKPGKGDGGGHFAPGSKGVTVDAAAQPPEKPILLHELMHAYYSRVLPQSAQNPDVLRFYTEAKQNELYPPGSYVLSNPGEFFAVTGSLYLWGNVDRPPRTRDTLRKQQPEYYQWLGHLFGVQKTS